MTARRAAIALAVVMLVTVVAPGGTVVPMARGATDTPSANPRECIAEVEGLFPFGATGARDAVLLVHGWTGRPETWLGDITKVVSDYNLPSDRSFAEEMKRLGDVDVWIIDYYEASHRWVDHPSVAGPIGAAIDCLHERYGRPIGYVAHSMGGLALRQVLAGREHRVGPVVTFGTPHLGSDIAVVLLEILDIAPDLADLLATPLKTSPNPLTSLGGYAIPFLVELLIEFLRSCGDDPFSGACDHLPGFVAAAYSEAGLALATGSPQLVGGAGVTPLPRLPQSLDGRVLSIAGDVRIRHREATMLRPAPDTRGTYEVSPDGVLLVSADETALFGTARLGDWAVTASSALGAGIGREELFACDYFVVPNLVTRTLSLLDRSFRSGELPVSEAFNGACAHQNLTSSREPTQFAIGFIQEHLRPELSGPSGSPSGAPIARPVRTGGIDPLVVVLDTSGSMAERDARGQVRMEGARAALRDLVESLPPSTFFGLHQYPDPVRAGCGGGVPVIPVAPLDAGRVIGELERLRPSGMTPTGPALRAAVDGLRRAGFTSGQVVLISDGESNCGEPPCDAAAAIVAEGFDITVNTLGFLISGAGQRELDCIASATGGRSFSAEDADVLRDALLEAQTAQLSVSVNVPESVAAGSRIEVEVIVENRGGVDAGDVRVGLVVRGQSFSAVLPPSFALGRIPAGEQVSRRWTVATDAAAAADGPETVEVIATANAEGLVSSRTTATVLVDDRPLDLDQAGGIFTEVLGMVARPVAVLGDGFSAGAAPSGGRGTVGRCGVGDDNYATVLFGPRVHTLACTDALISDILRFPIGSGFPLARPQVEVLASLPAPPSLAFLTLGMADAGILDLLERCTDVAGRKPPDCSDSLIMRTALERIENLLHQREPLDLAYTHVARQLAQDGTLVVLAYPEMFSRSTRACEGIDRATAELVDQLIGQLNDVIERAVVRARDRSGLDIRFSRTTSSAYRPANTACDELPFLTLPSSGGGPLFHPTLDGQRAIAAELVRWSQLEGERERTPRVAPRSVADEPAPSEPSSRVSGEIVAVSATELERSSNAATVVRPGEVHTVRAAGFAPGSRVEMRFESEPILVGLPIVRDDGTVEVVVRIPEDLGPGRHHLRLVGRTEDGDPLVRSAVLDGRPTRPGWVPFAPPVFALLAISSLTLALTSSRTSTRSRRRDRSAADDAMDG